VEKGVREQEKAQVSGPGFIDVIGSERFISNGGTKKYRRDAEHTEMDLLALLPLNTSEISAIGF